MRTTTNPAWPTQVRYPGQAAAPAGPVDMTMMYVAHHAFRRDLAAFARSVPVTPFGEREAWRRLAARWSIFALALHHHHNAEDAGLWPLLLDRADANEQRLLEAMEAEHAAIDPVLTACRDGFDSLADRGDEDVRAALTVRLIAARESLGRHLAHEETDAIALIQRVMTDPEWKRLEHDHFRATPPPRLIMTVVPWMVAGLPAEDRHRLLATLPWPMRVLHRLGRRRFERAEQRTFARRG